MEWEGEGEVKADVVEAANWGGQWEVVAAVAVGKGKAVAVAAAA